MISALYADITLILILLTLGSNRIIELINSRKNKGSRLTFRLISVFSLLSIVPSALMCLFSSLFFHNGIESWFNDRNRTALQESLNVAKSYLLEHQNNALADCTAISRTLEYHINCANTQEILQVNALNNFLNDLCSLKGINSAVLLNSSFNVIAHSSYSVNLHFLNIKYDQYEKLKSTYRKSLLIENNTEKGNIIAAACFQNINDDNMYLIIEKNIDADVLRQAASTETAFNEYNQLLQNRGSLEIAFILVFFAVSLLLLIASISVAIVYSWRIVNPISNLIDVSENIIDGDLNARAKVDESYEEVNILSKTFNQMITQVQDQRFQLEERIKFTSSVLAGVSSGVIGVEKNTVYIWNGASEKLLNRKINNGDNIKNIIPEIAPLLSSFEQSPEYLEQEIQVQINHSIRLFLIKIENIGFENSERLVITFDDLTDVALAQRKAAWSEVARRVAHEIKNPLTPIQLSAERIKRKYISQIQQDSKIFSDLIDVIVRQVGDIKRLIDEFSFFARLPEPVLKACNLCDICKQAIFLMQNVNSDIKITFNSDQIECWIHADERLLHQSIVNLLQNAINALTVAKCKNGGIWITLQATQQRVIIDIEDNGPGLPKDKMTSLATPYFTLMPKGTGLGLAIVKKIIQDHNGELTFGESVHKGAKVRISIPLTKKEQ